MLDIERKRRMVRGGAAGVWMSGCRAAAEQSVCRASAEQLQSGCRADVCRAEHLQSGSVTVYERGECVQ